MKISGRQTGDSLVEVIVAVVIILILVSIALPAFTATAVKSHETQAMSNAKQIGFACKSFSTDNDGNYPNYVVINGTLSKTQISDSSNSAFNQLIPTYLATLKVFYQPGSPETPGIQVPPDPDMSKVGTGPNQMPALPAGSHLNHWAYVTGMFDNSNASFPLITDGFNSISPTQCLYSTSRAELGGVWKGVRAIVVRVDDSAAVEALTNQEDMNGPNGIDLFDTSGKTAGWMTPVTSGSGNRALNPN